jgi:hypothetical protein
MNTKNKLLLMSGSGHLITLMLLAGFLLPFASYAQTNTREMKRQDKIETMKKEYIKERLSLSNEESLAFWPVYDQYHADQKKLTKAQIIPRMQLRLNYETLSDKELDEILLSQLNYQQSLLDLKKDYYTKLKKVLSVRKVSDYYNLERDFRKNLLKQSAGDTE